MARAPYEDTNVAVEKSKADIMGLLDKEGVLGVQWTMIGPRTVLRFEVVIEEEPYMVQLIVDPEKSGRPFKYSSRSKKSAKEQQKGHVAQESKRLHRTLWWYVKSKFEAVASGLESPMSAWLPIIEGPRGKTIAQEMAPKMKSLSSGVDGMLKALPGEYSK